VGLPATPSVLELKTRIQATLDERPDRPWCVHRLCELLLGMRARAEREAMLRLTQASADALTADGKARREFVSSVAIGVQCEDALYWSARSPWVSLDQFGQEYESPRILRRLGSHFECHGL
jgi:hypothetical protein